MLLLESSTAGCINVEVKSDGRRRVVGGVCGHGAGVANGVREEVRSPGSSWGSAGAKRVPERSLGES